MQRGAPQVRDRALDDLRVGCHLEHHDTGDHRLDERVEQQHEDGPKRDDAAHLRIGSAEEQRAFPHRRRELTKLTIVHALAAAEHLGNASGEPTAAPARRRLRLGVGIRLLHSHRLSSRTRPYRKDRIGRCARNCRFGGSVIAEGF
jgi:hypothetical protein